MPASIGVNLRVTGHCRQGGRKYMEDFFSVAYQQTEDEKDLEYAFFGIYDGHGGGEAATFAKERLMESIVRQKNFWSDRDEDVLKAIKDGYIATHYAMWKEQENWPKTASGLPSTAGTTASVAFIRHGKIYIGHVGDSGIILGYQEPGESTWKARPLTKDHKPENANEMSRIEQCGGKVVIKSGVPRVVWNRPRIGHQGPVRRSTPIDEIPFLAVARSLGDLWSYNSAMDEFVVSPDPDTACIQIDSETFRCLIFGTDGLWNMISPAAAVGIVQMAEQHNERSVLQQQQTCDGGDGKLWINPSKCLVERALECWSSTRMRADNTSVITLMLDPPGPPRSEVIRKQHFLLNTDTKTRCLEEQTGNMDNDYSEQQCSNNNNNNDDTISSDVVYPKNGLEIMTMYRNESSTPSAAITTTTTLTASTTTTTSSFPCDENVKPTPPKLHTETIQINEVSSSSSTSTATTSEMKKTNVDESCTRCTRSYYKKSKNRMRKASPLWPSSASKREHTDETMTTTNERLSDYDLTSASNVEELPPKKLQKQLIGSPVRSQIRTRSHYNRQRRLTAVTTTTAAAVAKIKVNANRSFTTILRSSVQTRNRIK